MYETHLSNIIERLSIFVSLINASTSKERKAIALIQFGGGYFGTQTKSADIRQCCAMSLSASLHLERPDIKVRVVDFASGVNPNSIANLVTAELSTPQSYAAVGYDENLIRRVPRPRVLEPAKYRPRIITWSSDDVILVTGGAKGITAECALAFAQATGARMALIGSSPYPTQDKGGTISLTLERFQAIGLSAKYYQCDVSNVNSVEALIQNVRQEMGEITGVIHGAGLNKPRRAEQVTVEEAYNEVAPKVLGALNLCQVLKDAPLKLFVGFSSIIGITGMTGNAWYGFSNEALDVIIGRFSEQHPDKAVFSIAFSIWGEVGMGVRMGSTESLARMGIGAIPTSEGVRRFLHLIKNDPGVPRVVISARLGSLDTWQPVSFSVPKASRFLEDVVYYYPEVEIVSRAHLSLDRDNYLQDHNWRGSYLFPTVFGLEAMAQAVAYVSGCSDFQRVRIENIHLERPIVVDPEKGLDIEIHAEVMEREKEYDARRIHVGISTEQTGFTKKHFAATFVLNFPSNIPQEHVELPQIPLDIKPKHDLYNWLLFQGPQFQRIEKVYSLDSKKCVFYSVIHKSEDDFFLLGDPFFRDSLLQSVQLLIPQDISLPINITTIERYRNNILSSTPIIGVAINEGRTEHEHHTAVFVIDERGNVVEQIQGYVLRILEHHADYPSAEEIANPTQRDTKLIQKELLNRTHSFGATAPEISLIYLEGLHALNREERHQREIPVITETVRRLLKNEIIQTIYIDWLETGKPVIRGLLSEDIAVSISHDDRVCLCVAGNGLQGCDIAPVSQRSLDNWIALLGNSREPLMKHLMEIGDSLDQASTRIWATIEAIRKAADTVDIDIKIDKQAGDSVLFRNVKSDNQLSLLTFPVHLTRGPERLIAVTVQAIEKPKPSRIRAQESHKERLGFDLSVSGVDIKDGPQGQPMFVERSMVTFKEAANPSRTVYFSHYFTWIGKLRELSIQPFYKKVVDLFSTGKWGMVTNYAETYLVGEAKSGDVIEGCIWVEKLSGKAQSTLDFCYEWYKILPDGGQKRIGVGRMRTTWVAVLDHGVLEAQPFPEFGRDYLNNLLPPIETRELPTLLQENECVDQGKELYRAATGPIKEASLLKEQIFETTLEDANLVGNIYYSNYYVWQGRVRDNFFYPLVMHYFHSAGNRGELRCVYSKVEHFREAMPFNKILVRMYCNIVFERGISLIFDYFHLTSDGHHEKLAFAEHKAVWYAQFDERTWSPASLPKELHDRIIPKDKSMPLSKPSLSDTGQGEKYDVIVIGSGIGGLSAAALLAKRGLKVIVLEQHGKLGGFCTSFERIVNHKGKKLRFVFDAGVHDIALTFPRRGILRVLEELGIDNRIEWRRVSHEFILSDLRLKVPHRIEDFIELLRKTFPNEGEGILRYFEEIEALYHELYAMPKNVHQLVKDKKEIQNLSRLNRWVNVPFVEMVDAYIVNKTLKQVLTTILNYTTDDFNLIKVSTAVPLYDYYYKGGYYPLGSSQTLPNELAISIKENGGAIRLNSGVANILIDNGRVTGVKLRNNEILRGNKIISNADIPHTFLELLGRENLQPHFIQRIEKLRVSCSVFMVFLGVDYVPLCEPATFVLGGQYKIKISIPSKIDKSLVPPEHSCITLIYFLPHEQVVTWNRRDKDYEERKKRFGDKMISVAKRAMPDLSKHVVFREEATPATIKRYTGSTDGAIYGLAIDEWHPPSKTPITGLYLVGAGTSVRPGIEDVTLSGIKVANLICKIKEEI